MPADDMHTTSFGLWSASKLQEATRLLHELGVKFEVQEYVTTQEILEAWCAWDSSAANPNIGYDLWILTSDLPKVGSKIVEAFPERRFGAP